MIRMPFICLILSMAITCLCGTVYAGSAEPVAIRGVQVNGLMTMDEDELLYMLGLQAGQSVTGDQVTQGIKRAFIKGIFNGLSVDEQDGLFVVSVSERDLVERVTVKSRRLKRKDIVNVFGFRKGDYVDEDILYERVSALEEHIKLRGYRYGTVRMGIER